MISKKTAIALSDVYAVRFGIISMGGLRNDYTNDELSDFLYGLNFPEKIREVAQESISPREVKEFILSLFTGSIYFDGEARQLPDEYIKLCQSNTFLLAKTILIEAYDNFSHEIAEDYLNKLKYLSACLREDGWYFYNGKVSSREDLMQNFGVYFDSETQKYVDMNEVKKENDIPKSDEFLIKVPLYKSFDLTSDAAKSLVNSLGSWLKTLDAFCVDCNLQSTFVRDIPTFHSHSPTNNADFRVNFSCSRDSSHKLSFFIQVRNKRIMKVGQFPSIADLSAADIKKYRKILGEYAAEFTRAIGLASHGVGVGSFVYLRRIFENLIEKAHQAALKDDNWRKENETAFAENQKRIVEKILLLKDYLPEFLVANRTIYGIVSKGIHELTEEECLKYFPIIKSGIELILDQEIERRAKIAKEQETQRQIQQIQGELATKDSQSIE